MGEQARQRMRKVWNISLYRLKENNCCQWSSKLGNSYSGLHIHSDTFSNHLNDHLLWAPLPSASYDESLRVLTLSNYSSKEVIHFNSGHSFWQEKFKMRHFWIWLGFLNCSFPVLGIGNILQLFLNHFISIRWMWISKRAADSIEFVISATVIC